MKLHHMLLRKNNPFSNIVAKPRRGDLPDSSYIGSGRKYQHFKGGYYRIIALGINARKRGIEIIYMSLNNNQIHVRNVGDWLKPTEEGDIRFRLVQESRWERFVAKIKLLLYLSRT